VYQAKGYAKYFMENPVYWRLLSRRSVIVMLPKVAHETIEADEFSVPIK